MSNIMLQAVGDRQVIALQQLSHPQPGSVFLAFRGMQSCLVYSGNHKNLGKESKLRI
jgi:hypothetical protein